MKSRSFIIKIFFQQEQKKELTYRAVRRPRRAAAADNLWAPPPTFVDRRAAAADNLSARRRYPW